MDSPTVNAGIKPGSKSPWWVGLPGELGRPENAERLLAIYRGSIVSVDPLPGSDESLGERLASHVAAGSNRLPDEAVVRLGNPGRPDLVAVEIVVDDMPFLVESLSGALADAGHQVRSLAHPVFACQRTRAGDLLDLNSVVGDEHQGSPRSGGVVESWVRIEIDDTAGAVAHGPLLSLVHGVLNDVRRAVQDWPLMRSRALELADGLEGQRPDGVADTEVTDAAAFLRWLADDRFTFLGYAEDRHDGSSGSVGRSEPLGLLAGGSIRREDLPVVRGAGPLEVSKGRRRVSVHRNAHPDIVTISHYGPDGEVVGESRLLGLISSSADRENVRRIPIVAKKVAEVIRRAGFTVGGHSARALQSVLETFPRDELLQAGVDVLLSTALGVLDAREHRQTRVHLRWDDRGEFGSCLVFLPRSRYSSDIGARIERLLRDGLGGATSTLATDLSDSTMARLHVTVWPGPGVQLLEVDRDAVDEAVSEAVRSWDDEVLDAAVVQVGAANAPDLIRRWLPGIPAAYRAAMVPAAVAVEDLATAERLLAGIGATPSPVVDPGGRAPLQALALSEDAPIGTPNWRLRLHRLAPANLSEVLPYVADLGVDVTDERPYQLTRDDGARVWIYDIGLHVPTDLWSRGHGQTSRSSFRDALAAAWGGRVESDALSQLVLAAGLTWRQVAVVRALAQYARQTGLPYTLNYIAHTLSEHSAATALLVELFETRHKPVEQGGPSERETAVVLVRGEIDQELEGVTARDGDRILRTLLSVVDAVLRTNFFQYSADDSGAVVVPEHLVFKLEPSRVLGVPQPVPAYEIWVHGPRVEGVHLRFGKVARGGLRWSDRREDFRTEVLGLVKAQVVKNSVIVPTGAKGGFVAKRLPDPAVDREAWWAEGVASYRTFIGGLLDVTDNLAFDGEHQVVVPPRDVVRHDDDDPYLVVAADKGTASFSDIANEIAQDRGFWLGDAFASGGSNGYDHKAMGITARGAWVSVLRHFREIGMNPQDTDITVVGIGDMSGDVFGNGMLLSEHIRLLAAFNHQHIFIDPDPDPAVSYAERARLFALARSSWSDYDAALLSPGGGVYARSAKTIPLSAEAARSLGLPADTGSMSPDDLVRAILSAPADLLWNGGIGTYVKASAESHGDVGDRGNDAVRIDAVDLRVRAVGEGGNLGLTQRARVEAARQGVLLNNDAIDNSAGVDCSDHEVNIKVLLDRLVTEGTLSLDERNATLLRMTEEVGHLVLGNNEAQNRGLSVESFFASDQLPAHRRLIAKLENAGELDPDLEALPSETELNRRAQERSGLAVPELAVLLAHAKISLGAALRASDLPDEGWVQDSLASYFPVELRTRFGARVLDHPLRREIAITALVNDMIDSGGIAFAFRAAEETGSSPAEICRAYAVATEAFGLRGLAAEVAALDSNIPAQVQAELIHEQQRLLDRAVRWLLRARPDGIDVATERNRLADPLREHGPGIYGLLVGHDRDYVDALSSKFVGAGVPVDLARRTATLLYVFPLLDIVDVAEATGQEIGTVASTWFLLSERYGFDALLTRVSALGRADRWDVQARAALRDDLYEVLKEFTTTVTRAGAEAPRAVESWEARHATTVMRVRQAIEGATSANRSDLAVLSVALRTLRTLIRQT